MFICKNTIALGNDKIGLIKQKDVIKTHKINFVGFLYFRF